MKLAVCSEYTELTFQLCPASCGFCRGNTGVHRVGSRPCDSPGSGWVGFAAFFLLVARGANFANLFALRRPELVRAYFAYAGNHAKSMPNPLDGTLAKVLKTHKIFPMIAHAEGDSVVPVAEARGLIDYFTRHGLEHASLVEPGGNHYFSDAMRAAGKKFVRKWCCGE